MKLVCSLLLILSSLQYADWGYAELNDSIIATPENFGALLENFEEIFVYFHLPDCKHCKVIE